MITVADIRRLLAERSGLGEGGDSVRPATAERTAAAVLVVLIERAEGLTVLLTRRTAHLNHHAGQIAFPGGRTEPEDSGPVACALREAFEETGLPPGSVTILGRLDDYTTVTGFCVTPVVGVVTPPVHLTPDPFEVAEVFEVPLAFLLDPAHHQRHEREVNGVPRPYWAIPYHDHYIWGATAGMLINFYHVLKENSHD